jgi:hypothetical protein
MFTFIKTQGGIDDLNLLKKSNQHLSEKKIADPDGCEFCQITMGQKNKNQLALK